VKEIEQALAYHVLVWGGFIHGILEAVLQLNSSPVMCTFLHKTLLLRNCYWVMIIIEHF